MELALDINGVELKGNDRVICIDSSILLIPMCTTWKRPERIGRKKQVKPEILESDDIDNGIIKIFNSKVRYAEMHRDLIIGKNAIIQSNPSRNPASIKMRVLVVKRVSGGYIEFWNDWDKPTKEHLLHWHPAIKFQKLVWKKKQ